MQLNPRYEGDPVLVMEPLGDPKVPLLRQRRRLAETLASFDADQWSASSRCSGWSNRDVICHLVSTNGFWAASMAAGRKGEPTRFLPGFDPAVTPSQLVEASPDIGVTALLARFVATNDAIDEALGGLDDDAWDLPAEAPPGHVALSAVAAHALWDAWVHERDVCLPLGLPVAEEPDEVVTCLRYAAGLGPAFLASCGSTRIGAFAVSATDIDCPFVVEVGPTVLVRDSNGSELLPSVVGGAVDLAEAFSRRGPLPELSDGDRWMIDSLGVVFDQVE